MFNSFSELKRLAAAIPADRWRVTMGSYLSVPDKNGKLFTPTFVLRDAQAPILNEIGSGKGNDGLSLDMIRRKWKLVNELQSDLKRARVILTPHSDTHHVIHIDDVSEASKIRLEDAGFTAAAVILTSPDKRNMIFTAVKNPALSAKQHHDIALRISQKLNQEYGDQDAMNAAQPFRAPGFKNMKPEYKGICNGDYPVITLLRAQLGDCATLQRMIDELVARPCAVAKTHSSTKPVIAISETLVAGEETKAYLTHVDSIRKAATAGKLAIRKRALDQTLDQSSIDRLAAERMRIRGWNREQIYMAIVCGCNIVRSQNNDHQKRGIPVFAEKIVNAAMAADIQRFLNQRKYIIKDEKKAGVIFPDNQK